jgi:hypothetical protein
MTDALTTTPATYLKASEDGHLGRMIEGSEEASFRSFFAGDGRAFDDSGVFEAPSRDDDGWYRARAVCYAQGAIAAEKITRTDHGIDNPYPQFSHAWEAWAEGHDDQMAGALEIGR